MTRAYRKDTNQCPIDQALCVVVQAPRGRFNPNEPPSAGVGYLVPIDYDPIFTDPFHPEPARAPIAPRAAGGTPPRRQAPAPLPPAAVAVVAPITFLPGQEGVTSIADWLSQEMASKSLAPFIGPEPKFSPLYPEYAPLDPEGLALLLEEQGGSLVEYSSLEALGAPPWSEIARFGGLAEYQATHPLDLPDLEAALRPPPLEVRTPLPLALGEVALGAGLLLGNMPVTGPSGVVAEAFPGLGGNPYATIYGPSYELYAQQVLAPQPEQNPQVLLADVIYGQPDPITLNLPARLSDVALEPFNDPGFFVSVEAARAANPAPVSSPYDVTSYLPGVAALTGPQFRTGTAAKPEPAILPQGWSGAQFAPLTPSTPRPGALPVATPSTQTQPQPKPAPQPTPVLTQTEYCPPCKKEPKKKEDKKKKKKHERDVCYRGSYYETKTHLIKRKRERIQCQ